MSALKPPEPPSWPWGRRVLVVDDDPGFRDFMCLVLRDAGGLSLRTAATGAVAVETAAEWKPELLFLDWCLVDMEGHEVLRLLRALPEPPKVVVVTGLPLSEVLPQLVAGGAIGCLQKPFRVGQLIDTCRCALPGVGRPERLSPVGVAR